MKNMLNSGALDKDIADFKKNYTNGLHRNTYIYPDEAMEKPTPEQVYLQKLLDLTRKSKIGNNLVDIAKEKIQKPQ